MDDRNLYPGCWPPVLNVCNPDGFFEFLTAWKGDQKIDTEKCRSAVDRRVYPVLKCHGQ